MSDQINYKSKSNLIALLVFLILTFGVAYFGSLFEPGEWYRTLNKPSWTPPGWIFGPVWGLLYLSMSVAAWLIWCNRSKIKSKQPIVVYLVQLVINGLWSLFFFGYQLIGIALIDIVLLLSMIAFMTYLFLKSYKLAGYMIIPYLLWVSFATALNFEIWRIN